MSSWQVVLLEPARQILAQIGLFLLKTISVIFILLIGWWISKVLKSWVTKVLRIMKFDSISATSGVDNFLAKGGISYSLSELLGVICYWLALLVTFIVALTPFNLITTAILDRIVSYIPNVITAIFILILGMFAATVLRNIIRTATVNAGITQVNILSKVVEFVVIIFTIAIALEQLNIGAKIIELTISILLGSLGLAAALAFGLGCKEIAGRSIADLIEKLKKK